MTEGEAGGRAHVCGKRFGARVAGDAIRCGMADDGGDDDYCQSITVLGGKLAEAGAVRVDDGAR